MELVSCVFIVKVMLQCFLLKMSVKIFCASIDPFGLLDVQLVSWYTRSHIYVYRYINVYIDIARTYAIHALLLYPGS